LITNGNAVREYELTLTQLGLGFTLSYYLGKNFDLKIMDIMATTNGASMINRFKDVNSSTEQKLKNPTNSFGVNAGAGFVFYILPPYISIETTAGYSLLSIDGMDFENGGSLSVDEDSGQMMSNFIKSGGFFAFAQLNLAIPL